MRINREEPTRGTGGSNDKAESSLPRGGATRQTMPPHMEHLLNLAGEVSGDPPTSGFEHVAIEPLNSRTKSAIMTSYRVAQQSDINLKPRDFSVELGLTTPSPLAQLRDGVKGRLPLAMSRSQQFQALSQELEQNVAQHREDRQKSTRLSGWFAALSPDERAQVTVLPASEGVASWMQPLVVRVGDDANRIFNAGHLLDLPREIIAALPADKQEWLEERRETWGSLGVDTGMQAQAFLEKHFRITQIDVDGTLPPELARICELEPALPGMLRALQEHGLTMEFIKAELTPTPVLDAVRNLAKSQRAFVSHWLGNLIENGDAPTLTAKDFENIAKGHLKAYRKAHKRLEDGSLAAQLTDAGLEEALDSRLDFVGSAELIRHFSGAVMGIVLTGGGPEQHAALERINRAIHEYFGSEWANRRVGLDDSWRVGASVRDTLMTLLWLAPGAEIVQRAMGLDGLAKFMAGSLDNVGEEFKGSIPTLLAAGVPTSDVVKRAGAFVPVVVADIVLSLNIDEIERTLGPHIAGGAFSLSAVMLPLFTSLYAVQYFASQYRQLDREGKLPDDATLSTEQRETLDELASKDGLIRAVSAALDKYKADPAVRDGVVAAMRKMEMPSVNENPGAKKPTVGLGTAALKGAKEVMVVNRAQLWLFGSSLALILAGLGLGDWILHDGALESLLGAAELPLALAGLHAGKLFNRLSWNRYGEKLEPLGLLGAEANEAGSDIATA